MAMADDIRESAQERTGATVVAIFDDRADAEDAVRDLVDAGFREDQLGAAILDDRERRALGESAGTATDAAASGAAKGVVGGGIVGGLIGLLGSLLIPGLGPIVVGGVLASTLTGAAAGAATGGLIGVLIGLGASEEEARYFEDRFRAGGILVTVEATGRLEEARAILAEHNGDLGPVHRRYADTTRVAPTESASQAYVEPAVDHDAVVYAAWTGRERRTRDDPSYTGPERRLARV